jgi:hypothetical protein
MLKRFLDKTASGLASSALGGWLIGRLIPFNFEKWGKMTSIKLDSEKQLIEAVLELKGEDKPVELKINYHLTERDGKTQMLIDRVESSREWLTTLLNEVALKQNQPIEIPPQAAVLLRGVLK